MLDESQLLNATFELQVVENWVYLGKLKQGRENTIVFQMQFFMVLKSAPMSPVGISACLQWQGGQRQASHWQLESLLVPVYLL